MAARPRSPSGPSPFPRLLTPAQGAQLRPLWDGRLQNTVAATRCVCSPIWTQRYEELYAILDSAEWDALAEEQHQDHKLRESLKKDWEDGGRLDHKLKERLDELWERLYTRNDRVLGQNSSIREEAIWLTIASPKASTGLEGYSSSTRAGSVSRRTTHSLVCRSSARAKLPPSLSATPAGGYLDVRPIFIYEVQEGRYRPRAVPIAHSIQHRRPPSCPH